MTYQRTRKHTAIITGASQGIGAATALYFAKRNHKIIAIARNEAKLQDLCQRITDDGGEADYISQDLSQVDQLHDFADLVMDRYNGIDRMILNAGYSSNTLFEASSHASRQYEFNLNYFSSALLIEKFLPFLLEQKQAQIIAVGSLTGLIPFPGNANYAASKAALYSLFRNLRIELADKKIHIGMVLPGLVKTGLTENLKTALPAATPEKIAESVYNAVKNKQSFSIPGIENNLFYFLERWDPRFLDQVTALLGRFFVPGLDQSLRERPLQ